VIDSWWGRASREEARPMRWSWLRSKRQQTLGFEDPIARVLLGKAALFWWNFGAEALHRESAKTAGLIWPSLPKRGAVPSFVVAKMKVFHPVALAWHGFAGAGLGSFYRGDFGTRLTFADGEVMVAEAHGQRAI
jgi:hypothetical protein